jgi:hypothetical protein
MKMSWQGMVLAAGLVTAAPCVAHATTMVLGEAQASPGQLQVPLPVSVAITSGQLITMFAWEMSYDPAVLAWDSVVLDPIVAALGKQIQTYETAPGQVRLVIYGLDRQAFTSGPLAQCLLRVLPSAAAGSSLVGLAVASAANGNGGELPLATADGRIWVEGQNAPLDTTPPVLTLTSPADQAQFVVGTTVTVAGTATDEGGLNGVKVNGTSVILAADGSFSHALSNLPAGPNTITVEASDNAGNVVTLTRFITMPAPPTPPSGALVIPAASTTARSTQWLIRNSSELTYWNAGVWLEQRVDFGAGGSWQLGLLAMNNPGLLGLPAGYAFNLAVAIDGVSKGALQVPGSTTAFQIGTKILTMPAGVHTVRFTWTNDYWLSGFYDANIRIKEVAFTPPSAAPAPTPANGPVVTILSPVDGSTVTGSTQTLRFSVENLTLKVNSTHLHVVVDNGSTWHVYSTSPLYLKNLSPGQHRVTITAVDGSHAVLSGTNTPVTTMFTVQ